MILMQKQFVISAIPLHINIKRVIPMVKYNKTFWLHPRFLHTTSQVYITKRHIQLNVDVLYPIHRISYYIEWYWIIIETSECELLWLFYIYPANDNLKSKSLWNKHTIGYGWLCPGPSYSHSFAAFMQMTQDIKHIPIQLGSFWCVLLLLKNLTIIS